MRDFGIRGLDLLFALERCGGGRVLVDTVSRGGRAGDALRDRADARTRPAWRGLPDAHGMTPDRVLASLRAGTRARCVVLVGCEPESLALEEGRIGLERRGERPSSRWCDAVALVDDTVARCSRAAGPRRRRWRCMSSRSRRRSSRSAAGARRGTARPAHRAGIGKRTCVMPSSMRFCFEVCARGTLAEGDPRDRSYARARALPGVRDRGGARRRGRAMRVRFR